MDTDGCAVLRLAESDSCRDAIFREINSKQKELKWLGKRKGTRCGNAIVDVHGASNKAEHLRQLFGILADHFSGKKPAKPGRVVDAVIKLLNHVRNNLFHGIKDPGDVDDRALLKRLNPLLRAVLNGAKQCRPASGATQRS